MKAEIWKPIPGYEGYEASSYGRIRSLPRVVERSNGRKLTVKGQMLKGIVDSWGYQQVNVGKSHGKKLIHILVMQAFVGPRPEGMHIRHLDGDKSNNRLTNLRYGTAQENAKDSLEHGTFASLKLTPKEAREIRRRRNNGEKLRDIADDFDVSINTVSQIGLGNRWSHV